MRSNWSRLLVGARYHVIWSVIGIASTVLGSFGAFAPWAYGTGRRQPAHPGRTDMLRDLSAQSDESASTTSSSSTNDISGRCCTTTRIITMNVERTYRWTKMLQSRVQFSSTAELPPTLFLADCIINIVESEFSIGDRPVAVLLASLIHSLALAMASSPLCAIYPARRGSALRSNPQFLI